MELTSEEFQQGIEGVKRYFDEKTSEMKSYVDEKNTELKNYVDDKISGVIFYVDERRGEIKNYVDEKFSGVQAQFLKLDTNDKIITSQIEDGKFASSLSVGVIAAIAALIMLAPLVREIIAGWREFFTRPKEDLNARISELEKKILALTEEKGR